MCLRRSVLRRIIHACLPLAALIGCSSSNAGGGGGVHGASGTDDGSALSGGGSVGGGSGGPWISRTPNPLPAAWPLAGESPQLVYDGARGNVVLFGGYLTNGFAESNSFLEWNSPLGQWVDRTPTPLPAAWPEARGGHAMAWDTRRSRLVVFGGYDIEVADFTNPRADLWVLDETT
jgi:hypothetical protein